MRPREDSGSSSSRDMPQVEDDLIFEGEEQDDAQGPKWKRYSDMLTGAEIEAHQVTHLPFCNWCPACVKGKAKDEAHFKKDTGDIEEVTVVSMD